jgi:amino acid efflux transporter
MSIPARPLHSPAEPRGPDLLSAHRATALYIGALLGPGLLMLPGLAAAEAGPASILAWIGLLGASGLLAAVFAALGRAHPSAGGVTGYAAGLGRPAGTATGWCFLAGVITGAAVVCMIGATYVTELVGGGQPVRSAVAAVLLLIVLALTLGGVRTTTAIQLALVGLLVVMLITAVGGSAASARAANWTPFAPHGWSAIGRAAAVLMLSFVGWEAVAPLTPRLAAPARLSRIIAAAFAVTATIYLSLAVAVIAVLGPRDADDVPVADLLEHAIGPAGRAVAAGAAIALTLVTVNAYLTGATTMAADLMPRGKAAAAWRFPAIVALAGLLELGLCAARLVTTTQLITVPTTLFLVVYLACMLAAARTLSGSVRIAAAAGAVAVAVVLLFTGWALALAALVVGVAWLKARRGGDPRPAEATRLEPQEVLEALPCGVVLGERGRLGALDGEVSGGPQRPEGVHEQLVGGQRIQCLG